MKAAANGALTLSVLDGWWDEAYNREVGWAIGNGEEYDNPEYQDQVESEALYDLLEQDIVPSFYERSADGLPRRWIKYMKSSIATLYTFNTQRMVREYTSDFYVTAHARSQQLLAAGSARARALAAWNSRMRAHWGEVRIEAVDDVPGVGLTVGSDFRVQARVRLGAIRPEEVAVELYLGRVGADDEMTDAVAIPMQPAGGRDGVSVFEAATVPCRRSGLYGYTVRVLPFHADEYRGFLPGLIAWSAG